MSNTNSFQHHCLWLICSWIYQICQVGMSCLAFFFFCYNDEKKLSFDCIDEFRRRKKKVMSGLFDLMEWQFLPLWVLYFSTNFQRSSRCFSPIAFPLKIWLEIPIPSTLLYLWFYVNHSLMSCRYLCWITRIGVLYMSH